MTATDLFTATVPTEPDHYWVKTDQSRLPRVMELVFDGGGTWWYMCGREECYEAGSGWLFGPRVPLPVAAPVECWAVVTPTAINTFTERQRALDVADVADAMMGYRPQVMRGVFIPTSVEGGDA